MPEYRIVTPEERRMRRSEIRMIVDETYSKWCEVRRVLDHYILTHAFWNRQAGGYGYATRLAREHRRRILLVFSGINWCPSCIELYANVLQTDEFENWAVERELILINIDYDVANYTEADIDLFEEYDIDINLNPSGHYGLPEVILLDPDLNILGRMGAFPETAADFIEQFDAIMDSA